MRLYFAALMKHTAVYKKYVKKPIGKDTGVLTSYLDLTQKQLRGECPLNRRGGVERPKTKTKSK